MNTKMIAFQNVLICLAAVILRVSSNPLVQRMALNTCPIHGNQQQQLNLPLELVQQLTQQPQQAPPATCPVHNPSNEANQQLISKVMSNPLIQALVNQNTRPSLPSKPASPHVVNNYFIIPSEVLLNETKKAENRNAAKINCNQPDDGASGRKNSFGRMPYTYENSGSRPTITKERKVLSNNPCDSDQGSRPTYRQGSRSKKLEENLDMTEKRDNDGRRKNKMNIYEYCESEDEVCVPQIKRSDVCNREDNTRSSKNFNENRDQHQERKSEMRYMKRPMPRPRFYNIPTIKDSSSNRKEVSDIVNTEILKESLKNDEINRNKNGYRTFPQNSKMEEKVDEQHTPKDAVVRNPNDEAIINEAKHKFPGMSEKVIRDLLGNVKQQLINNKQMTNRPPPAPMHNNNYYQRPPPYWPPNYMPNQMRPFYPEFFPNIGYPNIPRPRQNKKRKSKNRKSKKDQRKTSSSSTENTTIASFETGTSISSTELPEVNEVNKLKPFDDTTPYIGNGYHNAGLMQLGDEDEIPSLVENEIYFVEDYYPDFTKDSTAYAFDDELYDYYEDDFQRTERRILPGNEYLNFARQQALRKYLANNDQKHNDVSEYSNESGEIVFKTPPALEKPDFQTSKLQKEYQDGDKYFPIFKPGTGKKLIEDVTIKSTISQDITPILVTSSTTPRNSLKEVSKIETHFVNSKSVKYHTDLNATSSTKESEDSDEMNKISVDGDTTVVIAKSLKNSR